MTDLLYWLFYLSVLALVVGCLAYLIVTRRRHDENTALRSSDGESEPLFPDRGDAIESVNVDVLNPLNQGVLEYLRRRGWKAGLESASPTSVKDPFLETDTYPETGERLWKVLAASLPVDCRWIVCGAPVLVHPQTGILFGVAIGMTYCLQLTDADVERASRVGETEVRYSDGSTFAPARQFGPNWVLGSWQKAELEWCRAGYEALERAAAGQAAPEEGIS